MLIFKIVDRDWCYVFKTLCNIGREKLLQLHVWDEFWSFSAMPLNLTVGYLPFLWWMIGCSHPTTINKNFQYYRFLSTQECILLFDALDQNWSLTNHSPDMHPLTTNFKPHPGNRIRNLKMIVFAHQGLDLCLYC